MLKTVIFLARWNKSTIWNKYIFLIHIFSHELKKQFFDKILLFQYLNGIFMFNLKYFSIKSGVLDCFYFILAFLIEK